MKLSRATLLSLSLAVALVAALLAATSASAGGAVAKWLALGHFSNRGACPVEGEARAPPMGPWLKWRPFVAVEVSEEFKERVVSIATSDPDVSSLIDGGYVVSAVKPIIKLTVSGDGTVTARASSAVLVLRKNGEGRALVQVDVDQGKVVRIVVCTVKVVERA